MGIARTSKRLKLRSESSARFERGIDPDGVAPHADRAMELFAEVAGARVAAEAVDEYPAPGRAGADPAAHDAREPPPRHRRSPTPTSIGALTPLGIEVSGSGDELVALAPTFRPDLEREIDLVEEVARRVGFDAIGRTVARPTEQVGALTHAPARPAPGRRRLRRRGPVRGDHPAAGRARAIWRRRARPTDRVVEAANPLRAEESVLRTGILPGLLRAVAYNRARGLNDVALFELGRVFLAPEGGALLPDEPYHLAVAIAGSVRRRPLEDDRAVDAYDAVDVLRAVAGALEVHDWRLETPRPAGFHPSRTAVISVGGTEIGLVGEIDPRVVEALDLVGADRGARGRPRRPARGAPARPRLPGPVAVPAVEDRPRVRRRRGSRPRRRRLDAAAAGGDLVEDVTLFDVFRAETLGAGRKSLAFSVRYRAADRTLTDAEVAELRTAGHRGRHRRTRRGPAGLTLAAHGAQPAPGRARLAPMRTREWESTDFYAVLGVASLRAERRDRRRLPGPGQGAPPGLAPGRPGRAPSASRT